MYLNEQVFFRYWQHIWKNTFDHSGTSTDAQCETHLEKLTSKLTEKLAEEVKQCWLDPQSISMNKYLGHGNFFLVSLLKLLHVLCEQYSVKMFLTCREFCNCLVWLPWSGKKCQTSCCNKEEERWIIPLWAKLSGKFRNSFWTTFKILSFVFCSWSFQSLDHYIWFQIVVYCSDFGSVLMWVHNMFLLSGGHLSLQENLERLLKDFWENTRAKKRWNSTSKKLKVWTNNWYFVTRNTFGCC